MITMLISNLKISSVSSPTLLLLFFQIYFGSYSFFAISYELWNQLIFIYKNFAGILIIIVLDLWISLGRILSTLSLLICEHVMCLHLFKSYFIIIL